MADARDEDGTNTATPGSDEPSPASPASTADGQPARSAGPQHAPGGALGEAVGALLRVFAQRGRVEAERLANRGRVRLDLRQLRRDREVMYVKLGKEARALVEGGEVDHPGLSRGVERIAALEERIAQVESNLPQIGSSTEEAED